MKKLALNLDELKVSSFEAGSPARGEGTVEGREFLTRQTYCDGQETCYYTCAQTCDPGLC
jgi:hypothetical protein